jgi:uncharacterized membrane protein
MRRSWPVAHVAFKYGTSTLLLIYSVYMLNFFLFRDPTDFDRFMTLGFWGIFLILMGLIGVIGSSQGLWGKAQGVWAAVGLRTVTKGRNVPRISEVASRDQAEGSREGWILVLTGVIVLVASLLRL